MTNNGRQGAIVVEKNGRPFSVAARHYLVNVIQRGRRHRETKDVFEPSCNRKLVMKR
jgi:hypothetical protein